MSVKKNIIANLFGKAWGAILSLVLTPFYIKFLGVEAYGVIGFYNMILTLIILLDMGFPSTLNFELAKISTNQDQERGIVLLTTLERIFWMVGLLIIIAFFCLSSSIVKHWLKSVLDLKISIGLIGITVGVQLPVALYVAGLSGLQKQVLLNKINIVIGTLKGAGVLLFLWLVSPTLEAFFCWQILAVFAQLIVMAWCLRRFLPKSTTKFDFNVLKKIAPFTLNMAGISITMVILTQIDKIVLSKTVTLESFGYYFLASTLSSGLWFCIIPIFSAALPRFTELYALQHHDKIKELYHKMSQLIGIVILPLAAIVSFFSQDIIVLWTRNPAIAHNAFLPATFLFIGTAINGLMSMPYAIQVSHGFTKLPLFMNCASIIVTIPIVLLGSKYFGLAGAAISSIVTNLGSLLIAIPIMHKKFLQSEMKQWYCYDVVLPIVGAFVPVALCYLLSNGPLDIWQLSCFWLLSATGNLICSSEIRRKFSCILKKLQKLEFRQIWHEDFF